MHGQRDQQLCQLSPTAADAALGSPDLTECPAMTTLADLGAATRAVWTRAQARTVLTEREIQTLLDDGSRRRKLRAVASGRSAARVWGLPLIDDDDPATGASEHRIDDVAVWYH